MAASTFTATGTYTTPSGAAASGKVTFLANNTREANTNTIQDALPLVANLVSGSISQVLVINVGGYTVLEQITGADAAGIEYVIPGVANINLADVDASTANFDASDVVNVVTGQTISGTTYTFALADGANVIKRFTSSSAITATIDGSVTIPVGTVITLAQMGTGKVTCVCSNGTSYVSTAGNNSGVGTRARYSQITLRKDTSTQWHLTGDIG